MSDASAPTDQNDKTAAPPADPAKPATPAEGAKSPQPEINNIFDAAGLPTKDADGNPLKPGWLPGDQFWDADKNEVRVEDLAKSWLDLRRQVSTAGGKKGAEAPPETAEGYKLPEVEGLPAGVVGGEKDTLWPEIRNAAHKAGVSQSQLEAIAKPYLAQVARQLAEAQKANDPEAARAADIAAFKAEMAKLGENGEALTKAVGGRIAGMETSGFLAPDEALALRAIATAPGVRAFLKIFEMIDGKPIPTEALDAEDGSLDDAKRLLAEGYAQNDPEKKRKGDQLLKRLEAAGRLRTRAA